jgi:hypothetical protein
VWQGGSFHLLIDIENFLQPRLTTSTNAMDAKKIHPPYNSRLIVADAVQFHVRLTTVKQSNQN